MTADRCPLPDNLKALKDIIGGKPADSQTIQRLITCNLVEEFDGTALLTIVVLRRRRYFRPLSNEMVVISSALHCSNHNSYANCVGLGGCAVLG
jgi:hypothetical protein